ncbi:Nucleus export protein Brr6 [Macrophomina phaseolina MS6]|uniref:Nucleus export protein Brr6 n=2 Tax=Macrophomina phaseolina TaxID=35725 RepID=K2SVK0_MACPH|nr:Nucleus export protein Brr6 [Macrophomina phaseolina MS6]KAH7042146.1 Di-sulfide bridge nucleocytoplasmic transport domain-containing protein [Macrophomina phaseolina]
MDRFRSAHTPMEYEYTNGTGPVDESSPFIIASRNASAQNKKRNYGLFDTPNRQTPSLRPPASQPFYFSQPPSSFAANTGRSSPTKPLSSVPEHLRDAKFSTPRKPANDFNFSSGGETPETPGDPDADNADSEATPDSSFMGFRNRAVNFMAGGKNRESASPTKSPTKERRRDSWISGLSKALSPGKETSLAKAPYSDKAEKRIIRRRQKEADRRRGPARSRRGADADSDDDDKSRGGRHSTTDSVIGAILSYIDAHPNLPHTLSFYAQLILNFFFVGCIIWIVYSFWSAIQSDVNIEADRAIAEALAEMAVCAREYQANRCAPETRVPAMATLCDNWDACMNRDPKKVGRARVSAHTFATIFNSFIEPISWKAMFFCLMIVIICLFVNNIAFTKFRNTHPVHHNQQQGHPHDPYQQWQQQQWPGGVPPTPQRYPSNGWDTPGPHMIGGFYQTPAHHAMQQYGGYEPRPSQTPGHPGEQQHQQQPPPSSSPIKRLQF